MRSRRSTFLLRPLTMWNIKAVGWATYEQRLRANMLGGCAVLLVPVEALRDRAAARPSMWHGELLRSEAPLTRTATWHRCRQRHRRA
ncbi:hypothetical protein BD311DRAFT_270278 [Dichomitus squalens]|uniref:Uncharacterized protein n=1 Tax=Dichomitus squalens TaxID=114155 RepID=A0A4V6MVY9_9APHY|nr:hypothetical protein BD311DRAFT_270278 [Dichomitus squalens]